MCLELPRGKDVMNIKWALEAPDAAIYISIYAQVRKQPQLKENSNIDLFTFYLVYPAMLCNGAQEKTKTCSFALWQRRKKKPFVPLPWATTGTACLLRKYSLRVPKATQTKGNQTNEMKFSTSLRGVYSREFANLFLILSINIEETNRSLLLERHRRRLSQPNPELGISQARPRTSERDCCCFVRPRKRRLLTVLPLQNYGKGDAGVENCRENGYRDSFAVRSHRDMLLRLVASAFFLRAVTTTNDAVAELSGEHAASIPRTLTSLPARCSGFIYSASFHSNRIATSTLVVVATPNDAVSELSRPGRDVRGIEYQLGEGVGVARVSGASVFWRGSAGTDRREAPYPCYLSRRQAVATTRAYSVLLPYHGTREEIACSARDVTCRACAHLFASTDVITKGSPGAFHDKCVLPSSD
ncbi:hypothetical protein ALC53_01620 [Atta colombica]|uniref:Uncharacterized protein n=1 Tax=Atta colombica TaxID=520822 RepID=A0A195BTC1_9HYME|nr:hypothetical protein ALC53_01620 [Atta colombica]